MPSAVRWTDWLTSTTRPDDVTYDVIELFEDNTAKEIIEKLVDRYPQTEIEEAIQEVNELKDNEELFTEDTYKERIIDFKKRQTVVKALCLHIAHDCNLACRYCFAEEGEYHGRRALMSYETGKQALDFLIANSGSRRNLEVDFFGGEPLMNWDVVKQGRYLPSLHLSSRHPGHGTHGRAVVPWLHPFAQRRHAGAF